MEENSGIGLISTISNMPILGGNLRSFMVRITRSRGHTWGSGDSKFDYENRDLLAGYGDTSLAPILSLLTSIVFGISVCWRPIRDVRTGGQLWKPKSEREALLDLYYLSVHLSSTSGIPQQWNEVVFSGLHMMVCVLGS